MTAGYVVRSWHPASLPTGERLRADVTIAEDDRNRVRCVFHLAFRDRSDIDRRLELDVDTRTMPAKVLSREIR